MKRNIMLYVIEILVMLVTTFSIYRIFIYVNNNKEIDTLSYFCGIAVMVVVNIIIDVFNNIRGE